MAIGSIQNYLDSLGVLATSSVQQAADTTAQTASVSTDSDSYESTITGADTVYPCENYNGIQKTIASAKSQESDSATTDSETTASTEETQAAGGSGGGSSDDSEEETTTEIVTINGVTYLETTTTTNGVSTTTRTVISGEEQ